MARGDIVLVDLPETKGSAGREQVGTRPALIVHDDGTIKSFSVIMIVPFTSQISAQRFAHTIIVQPSALNGLSVPSVLLIFQLRAIDKTRILKKIGQLESDVMNQVDIELRKLLSL
jgi:mRNA interferase MazF